MKKPGFEAGSASVASTKLSHFQDSTECKDCPRHPGDGRVITTECCPKSRDSFLHALRAEIKAQTSLRQFPYDHGDCFSPAGCCQNKLRRRRTLHLQCQFRPLSRTRILPLSLFPSNLAAMMGLCGGPNVPQGWEGTIRITGGGSATSQ